MKFLIVLPVAVYICVMLERDTLNVIRVITGYIAAYVL